MNRRSIRSLAMVLGVACLAIPGLASAKPNKVALTPIDGDPNGDVGEAVADAIDGDDLSVIARKTVTRAVDKLGYEGELSEKQAKKVGTELEADAVVQGRLDKSGSSKLLHFTLFVHGKKSKGFTVSFSNVKSQKFKTMLRDKMVSKLGAKSGDEEATEEEPKAKKPKKKLTAEEVDDEDPVAGKKPKKLKKAEKAEKEEVAEKPEKAEKASKSEKAETSEAADGEDEEEATPRKKKKKVARVDDEDAEDAEIEVSLSKSPNHAANRVAARADVGVGFANRTLTFTKRANFPEGPKAYKNSPVPSARFEAELYPLAFTSPKSFAAGLGLAVEYDKTLSLTLRTTQEAGVAVKTNQQHYSVGARLRIPFGNKATSPSVTLGVGYGRRTFVANRTPLMNPTSLDIPDTDYRMIDPGISFRVPLATSVALLLAGKGMLITDAGPIQKADSYGQAKVFGGTAQAGIDIVLGNRFAIRLVGEFTQVGFSFTGKGAESNARDGKPETIDVGGAADRSVGGAATLAVLY